LDEYKLTDDQLFASSGKLVVLKKLLAKLYANKNRILIFSQMTKMLDILEPFLNYLGYSYLRLDGATEVSARQGLIDKFNGSSNIFAFLLSTRAAGLGINLTSADTVIFYDICFNPQVDRQAEDRCHRLGQTKQVHVYKLVVEESCEEDIYEMAHEKKELNDIILQEGNYQTKETSENLSKFLGDLLINSKKSKKKKKSTSGKKTKSKSKKSTKSKSTKSTKSTTSKSESTTPAKKKSSGKKTKSKKTTEGTEAPTTDTPKPKKKKKSSKSEGAKTATGTEASTTTEIPKPLKKRKKSSKSEGSKTTEASTTDTPKPPKKKEKIIKIRRC